MIIKVTIFFQLSLYKRIQDSRMKGSKFLNNCYCNEHPDEKLNLVCIQNNCPKKGLLCSLCKFDPNAEINLHRKHEEKIVPFKYLIQSLEASFDSIKDFNSVGTEEIYMKKLESFKDEALYGLKNTVESMSRMIQDLEERIIGNYQSARSSIMYRSETLRKLGKVIQRATIHDTRKQEKFQLINEMRSLASFIRVNEGPEVRYRYELDLNPNFTIAKFMEQTEYLKGKCHALEESLFRLNPDLLDFSSNLQPREEVKLTKKEKRFLDQSRMVDIEQEKPQVVNVKLQKEKHEQKPWKSKLAKKKKEDKHWNQIKLLNELDIQKMDKLIKPYQDKILDQIISQQNKLQPIYHKLKKIQQKGAMLESNQKIEKSSKMFQMLQSYDEKKEIEGPVFSNFNKNVGIKLAKFGKWARQTTDSGLVLVSQNLEVCPKLSLKINRLIYSIVIGVALSEIVVANHCGAVNYKSTVHGIYGVDQNGLCLYHDNPVENNLKKPLMFQQRDIINLKWDKGFLWIQRIGGGGKKNHKNGQSLCLQLKLPEPVLKKTHFCVYLAGKDDSAQII